MPRYYGPDIGISFIESFIKVPHRARPYSMATYWSIMMYNPHHIAPKGKQRGATGHNVLRLVKNTNSNIQVWSTSQKKDTVYKMFKQQLIAPTTEPPNILALPRQNHIKWTHQSSSLLKGENQSSP
jgi:hypothetical protein